MSPCSFPVRSFHLKWDTILHLWEQVRHWCLTAVDPACSQAFSRNLVPLQLMEKAFGEAAIPLLQPPTPNSHLPFNCPHVLDASLYTLTPTGVRQLSFHKAEVSQPQSVKYYIKVMLVVCKVAAFQSAVEQLKSLLYTHLCETHCSQV